MKLIAFELRKLFAGKVKWILALLFFLNLAVYYVSLIPAMPTEQESEIRKEWETILAQRGASLESNLLFLQQELTDLSILQQYFTSREFLSESDIERALSKYSGTPYMDEHITQAANLILYQLQEEHQAAAEYQAFINGMESRGKSMLEVSIFAKDGGFAKKNIQKTVKDFSRVKEIEVSPVNGIGISRLLDFYLTDIFLLVLVCLLAFQEFGQDSKSGMGDLIQATPRGKGWLRFSQMCAIWISVAGFGLLFYGCNLIQSGLFLGMDSFSEYVQSISAFRNVPYPVTIGQFLLFFLLGKVTAALFISTCCQFLAIKFNGEKIAWFFFGAAVGVSFLLWFLIPDTPAAKIFRYLNLVGILDMKQILGNYQNLNIFSHPVSLLHAAAALVLILGILISGITLAVNRTTLRIRKPDKTISNNSPVRTGVLYYEHYKIFRSQKIWLIGLVLILVGIRGFSLDTEYISGQDFYYQKHISEFQGAYSEEKKAQIEALTANQDTMDDKEKEAVDKLYLQCESLAMQPDHNVGFVNLRTLEKFFFAKQEETIHLLMLVIAVILSVSTLFYQDKKKGIDELLRAAPLGNKVYWSKVKIGGLFGGLYAVIIWSFTHCEYFMRYGIENSQYSIHSIPEFSGITFECSILTYMVITMLFRCLIGIYLGVLLAFLSQVLTSPTQNIICGILLLVLPLCLYYVGSMGYDNPLVRFINQNLSFSIKPVKILASFQAECHNLGMAKLAALTLLPVVTMVTGKFMWQKK